MALCQTSLVLVPLPDPLTIPSSLHLTCILRSLLSENLPPFDGEEFFWSNISENYSKA